MIKKTARLSAVIFMLILWSACASPGSRVPAGNPSSGNVSNVSISNPKSKDAQIETALSSGTINLSLVKDFIAKTVVWQDNGCGLKMEEIKTNDGTCWKMTGTGDWMAMSLKVRTSAGYSDMTGYRTGTLRFRYKGERGAFLVGVKSKGQDNGKVVWAWIDVTNSTGPNRWYQVVIPIREFMKAPSSLDLRKIEHLFMFASFKENGYRPGDSFLIGDVSWSKQPNL